MTYLDRQDDDRELSDIEVARLSVFKFEGSKWRMRKAQMLMQFSRVKNLTLRDHNTSYFHAITSIYRRKNHITRIKIRDTVYDGMEQIREKIRSFFENSYKQEDLPHFHLPMRVFKQFNSTKTYFLDEIPSTEEIKREVWTCDHDKVPGYDVFSIRFIKTMWSTISCDIVQFAQQLSYLENSQQTSILYGLA